MSQASTSKHASASVAFNEEDVNVTLVENGCDDEDSNYFRRLGFLIFSADIRRGRSKIGAQTPSSPVTKQSICTDEYW